MQVTKNGGFVAFETPDGKFLLYGKGRGQTTLWKVSTAGGEEVQVLDNYLSPGGARRRGDQGTRVLKKFEQRLCGT